MRVQSVHVFEVPGVDFIRPCGVFVFALFYCLFEVGLVLLWVSVVFLSMFLVCVLCLTVLVKCLLNVFPNCVR